MQHDTATSTRIAHTTFANCPIRLFFLADEVKAASSVGRERSRADLAWMILTLVFMPGLDQL